MNPKLEKQLFYWWVLVGVKASKTKRLFYKLKLLPMEALHYKPLTFSRLQLVTGLQHSCAEHFKHFFSIMLNSRNLSQLTSLRLQPWLVDFAAGQRHRCRNTNAKLDQKLVSWEVKILSQDASRISWFLNGDIQRNNVRYFWEIQVLFGAWEVKLAETCLEAVVIIKHSCQEK